MDTKVSKHGLDRAGKIIQQHQDGKEYRDSIDILNRWREQHVLPMDFYFDAFNGIIRHDPAYNNVVIAERLKRLPTILDKLKRFPHMHLSTMYDIGGVRVILDDMELLSSFQCKVSKLPGLKASQCKDYITKPKSNGYRGRHLVFKHDEMLVEVQLRTKLQHLWATSVETIDAIRGTSMKTEQSNNYWQRFFELASSAFAYIENLPMLPQHQGWDVIYLIDKIQDMLRNYPIEVNLKTYVATHGVISDYGQKNDSYYALVTLNSRNNETSIAYYPEIKYQEALSNYKTAENNHSNNSVLVSVSDLRSLRDAYPNYFKDISRFTELITTMLDFRNKMR